VCGPSVRTDVLISVFCFLPSDLLLIEAGKIITTIPGNLHPYPHRRSSVPNTQSETESLLDIVRGVDGRTIMLPEFQRDFRWERTGQPLENLRTSPSAAAES
jgi:hypothetical protein